MAPISETFGMKWILTVSAAFLCLPCMAQLRPFPQHVSYVAGTLKPTNYTQAQQDTDVRNAWQAWRTSFVVAVNPTQYRVAAGKAGADKARTVSEGQGYGMVLSAIMAGSDSTARIVFDGLWRFSRAHPSSREHRLMAWEVPTASGDQADSAFDGDADIAYALLLADAQWGSAGTVNYKAEALKVIAGIKAATIGKTSHLPMLGDWVNDPDSSYTEWQTRTSDFMYGHFRAYRRASNDASWDLVLKITQAAASSIQANFSASTGLLPDFLVPQTTVPYKPKPAPSKFLEDPNDGSFYYNACRDPWRIGTDALINGDATSLAQARKMSAWIAATVGNDPKKVRAGYKLTGQALKGSDYFTTVFVAPWGVAAMTNPSQQAWLNKVYAAVRTTREDYFEDSVTLMSMLVMTGNFWDPTLK